MRYNMNTALLIQSVNQFKHLINLGSYESYDMRHIVILVPCIGRCSSGGLVPVDSHDFHHPPGKALVKLLEIWCMFDGFLCCTSSTIVAIVWAIVVILRCAIHKGG